MQHAAPWDIIVVRAGHNGLTAGALLARAGLATLVVERRDVIGGCFVTEEIAPGYHCGPVHPELCGLIPAFRQGGGDLDWDDGIPHREGTCTFTLTGTTTRAPFPGLSGADLTRHRGELVLPNLMLSLSADHVAAFTVWTHGAGHTTVLCDFAGMPR